MNFDLQKLSRNLAVLTGAVGLLALAGWMFNISILKSGMTQRPEMLPSIALMLTLFGIALLLISPAEFAPKVRYRTGQALAVGILLLALFSGSDDVTWRQAIENSILSLIAHASGPTQYNSALRCGPSPIFFAVALLLVRSKGRKGQRFFTAMAVLPICVALLALIGHAYHIPSFYGNFSTSPKPAVSLPAAIAYIVFGVALLTAKPELELTKLLLSRTIGGYVARRLLLAPVIIPAVTGLIQLVGVKSGHYNPELASWLFSFANIFIFSLLIGWISMLLYRTDLNRQLAEQTVHDLNETLEEQVRKRTNELTESNLRLAGEITERQRMDAQLLRAQRVECLGSLSGGIAHDLNNMLSPILVASGLLQREVKSPEAKRYMAMIVQSAERGGELVKQIMMFARGAKSQGGKVNITELLADLRKTLEATFPRSIVLKVEIAPDLPQFAGNATQIHQVLMNLCINARDAMPQGGILLITAMQTVNGANTSSATPSIEIKVTDTGTGIAAENISKIFDPFFTTKDPDKGTGLGLATVKKIVANHGGTVRVESEIGKGTTFIATFAATAGQTPPQEADATLDFHGHGEHILLVEDELALREIVKATLEQAHYTVTSCANGIEALELAQQSGSKIDLVLTDFEMPFMTGRGLVDELSKRFPLMRFIVMTGSLELREYQRINTNGKWRLAKPFTTPALLKLVHEVLRDMRVNRGAEDLYSLNAQEQAPSPA